MELVSGLPRLCEASLARLPAAVRRPLLPRPAPAILHLGLGAFHRAHMAVYTEEAEAARPGGSGGGGWGIVGATLRSAAVRDRLAPQDGLYSLIERDGGGERARVVGALRAVLSGPDEPAAVIAGIAAAETRIVSLTVTEKGYALDPASRRLRLDDPGIAADLAPAAVPRTPLGLLVAGLAARRRQGRAGVTVLCCDNLPANGVTLQAAALAYAEAREPGLAAWIEAACRFPGSMVDRIVPAATEADRAAAAQLTGLHDAAPVVTEPFCQWVVEDDFAAGRPAWELAGVQFVAEVAPYETMKLRLLNGAHSAIAYLGLLAGKATVSEVVAEPRLRRAVEGLMAESAATVPLPSEDYRAALLTRFANPALAHRCAQIAMDGSQKLPQRLLAPIRERLERGLPIERLALAVAAWLRFVSMAPADDPLEPAFARCRRASADDSARALLALEPVFGRDLPQRPAFTGPVLAAARRLAERGVMGTLA